MKKHKLKLKISLPEGANVYAENGDSAKNLLLYEVDQLEVLEEVRFDTEKVKFNLKDGQFVNKGEIVFTEGFLGHKAMMADSPGIVEIKNDRCRILGQKRHSERRINFEGKVIRVVPNRFIELQCYIYTLQPVFYFNYQTRLADQVYFSDKSQVTPDKIKFPRSDTTYFINDNLYLDELTKIIALGAKRVIVNGIFIDDIENFKREIDKLDSFCIISGFGEYAFRRFDSLAENMDILWGKKKLHVCSAIENEIPTVYEHPFWGMQGDFEKKNELVGILDYNREAFEFYLKNLGKNI